MTVEVLPDAEAVALSVTWADVAVTGFYKGTRRMTMALDAINRARRSRVHHGPVGLTLKPLLDS